MPAIGRLPTTPPSVPIESRSSVCGERLNAIIIRGPFGNDAEKLTPLSRGLTQQKGQFAAKHIGVRHTIDDVDILGFPLEFIPDQLSLPTHRLHIVPDT